MSEIDRHLYKRTLIVVCIAQLFSGAGLSAGLTVGALIAQDMLDSGSFTGIPIAILTLGSAIAAYLIGRISNKRGRRTGLSFGFLFGGLGSLGIIAATYYEQIALLMVSLLLYGSGTASNLQARYAGTDLAKKHERATAVSIAMVSTTFGAVLAPNLVEPMGRLALSIHLPQLSGIFMLSAAAFLIAGIIIQIFLRPDPLLESKKQYAESTKLADNSVGKSEADDNKKGIIVGTTILILTQIVMAAIMTMTPIHMGHHGHELKDIGLVISIHIGSMYLPSLFTGLIIDKIGRIKMSIVAGIVLIVAALVTALAPGDSLLLMIIGLALLGIGWNCGLISGTALVVDSTTPSTRARKQGQIDVLIAIAGASGGLLSGIVVAAYSFRLLSFAGLALALLFIPVVIWSRKNK